jgi:hypothetical protein
MRLLRRDRFAFGLLAVYAFFLLPSLAAADGGTIRLSEQKGNYRITVFTGPTPLRAGPVDISVLVQEAATQEPLAGVQVTIKAKSRGSSRAALNHPATSDAATNKLFYAATFDLPEPGWYSVEVSIDGVLGKAQVAFEVNAAEPLPPWLILAPWVGWPVVAILLFGIHQVLVRLRPR